MHRFTLQFDNKNLEDQYFSDQYKEMLNFYLWACYLGSLSALTIFVMEFILPFGFGNLAYGLFLIPIAFYISYNFLKKHPYHYNLVLALINVTLGFMIYYLLYVFANSKVLFLAGQTVAMIQYSMLLGSNVIVNILILLFNSLGLMLMCTFIQEFMNCLQIMFILALILVTKAVWSQEKLKRQFFLLKTQNSFLQSTLDNVFELKIIHCRFDSLSNGFQLVDANKQAQKILKNQKEFLQFIRQFKLINYNQQKDNLFNFFLKKENRLKLNLEQLMLKAKKKQITELSTQISSIRLQEFYRISIYQQILNEESQIILLLQEDTQSRQILKLRKSNSRYKFVQHYSSDCFNYARISLGYLKFILNHRCINSTQLFYILNKSQQFLYQSIHGFYNIQIFLDKVNFGKIIKFNISTLQKDLLKLWGIYDPKQEVKVYTRECKLSCETNYAVILQILLNIFLQTLRQDDYDEIFFNVYSEKVDSIQLIKIQIVFKFENTNFKKFQTNDQIYQNKILERVNKKMYKIVCLSKEQKVTVKSNCYTIELDLIQSLVDFKTGLETYNI